MTEKTTVTLELPLESKEDLKELAREAGYDDDIGTLIRTSLGLLGVALTAKKEGDLLFVTDKEKGLREIVLPEE